MKNLTKICCLIATLTTMIFNLNAQITLTDTTGLPIELIRFEGVCGQLEWVTASETNNDRFIIESSLDGSNWKYTAMINGAGNSNTVKDYYLSLEVFSGARYYRLTQVDFDGESETFDMIFINCNNSSRYVLSELYYGLDGNRIEIVNGFSGIVIRKTTYSNGDSESRKVLIKQ